MSKIKETPPGERVCFASGMVFPESNIFDWEFFPKNKWVHKEEMAYFIEHYAPCARHGSWHRKKAMLRSYDGQFYSKDGADASGLVWCPADDVLARNEDTKMLIGVHGESVTVLIHHAGTRCEFTGKLHLDIAISDLNMADGSVTRVSFPLVISPRIADKSAFRCVNCGGFFESGLAHPGFKVEGRFSSCVACVERMLAERAIRRHDDQEYLDPIFGGNKRFQILYGVELEAGIPTIKPDRKSVAVGIMKSMGCDFVYCKHDGSIARNDTSLSQGLEIVSAPATLDIHRQKWPALPSSQNYKKLRSWDTKSCGMHVHYDRNGPSAGTSHLVKTFINSCLNRPLVALVSGRVSEDYANLDHSLVGDGKYTAVRTTPNTIEVRIFRGTINPRHVVRNIEFVDALIEYSRLLCDSLGLDSANRKAADSIDEYVDMVLLSDRWPLLKEWLSGIFGMAGAMPDESFNDRVRPLMPGQPAGDWADRWSKISRK